MKATHTARLKTIFQLTQDVTGKIGIGHVKLLMNEGGKLIDVASIGEFDNGFFKFILGGDLYNLKEELFVDIKEIKPVIEIPETPFWFKINKSVYRMDKIDREYISVDHESENARSHQARYVYRDLNSGEMTICDEPEKKMIPSIQLPMNRTFYIDKGDGIPLETSRIKGQEDEYIIYYGKGIMDNNYASRDEITVRILAGDWTICEAPEKKMIESEKEILKQELIKFIEEKFK